MPLALIVNEALSIAAVDAIILFSILTEKLLEAASNEVKAPLNATLFNSLTIKYVPASDEGVVVTFS